MQKCVSMLGWITLLKALAEEECSSNLWSGTLVFRESAGFFCVGTTGSSRGITVENLFCSQDTLFGQLTRFKRPCWSPAGPSLVRPCPPTPQLLCPFSSLSLCCPHSPGVFARKSALNCKRSVCSSSPSIKKGAWVSGRPSQQRSCGFGILDRPKEGNGGRKGEAEEQRKRGEEVIEDVRVYLNVSS